MGYEVTDHDVDAVTAGSSTPIVLEFYATWCGNCRRIEPALKKLAADFSGRVRLMTVNAEENPELVRRYGVRSTPTLIALAGKDPVTTLVGAQREDVLRGVFDTAADATASSSGGTPVPSADAPTSPVGPNTAASDVSWVPGDACTLPGAQQPRRLEEFEHLFASALRSVARQEPTQLRPDFAAATGIEQQVRALTAKEAECCTFFDFSIESTGSDLTLGIRVPPDRADVLTGIEQQAVSARRRSVLAGSAG